MGPTRCAAPKQPLIYRRTKNLRAVQLLLGHTKLESTVRYLGIEVDDTLELAEQTEAYGTGPTVLPAPLAWRMAASDRKRALRILVALSRVFPEAGPGQMRPRPPCGYSGSPPTKANVVPKKPVRCRRYLSAIHRSIVFRRASES